MEADGKAIRYIYDAIGQLTSFTRSDGQSESYAYDAAGNMLTKTQNGVQTAMSYNAANQLVQSVKGGETTTYTYDANGNLVKSENAAGARSYAYNARNLLAKYTDSTGYSEAYTYNANRLLSSITNNIGTTSLTWDILYGDGVVIGAAQNGENTRFVYGLERILAISGSSRTEYVYDGRGSVAAELIYNGKELADTISKSYSPFGEQFGEEASGFGYNGEYYNAATGLIYLRARFYAPEMNRFSQKDLLRGSIFAPKSLNRYCYCQNDPVDFIDPSGMFLFRALVGAVAGAIVGAVSGVANEIITAVVEKRPVNWKNAATGAAAGAAGGATAGAVFAATGSVHLAATAGGAVGGAVGGYVGTKANGGSKEQAIANARKGALAGAAGGFVGGAVGGVVAAQAGGLVGMMAGGVYGGATAQYASTLLNGGTVDEAIEAATDPKKALINAATGAVGYGVGRLVMPVAERTITNHETRQNANAAQSSVKPGQNQEGGRNEQAPKVESPQGETAKGCGGSGSEEYVPPEGGGGITDSITIGDETITFGHGGRHLVDYDLSVSEVNTAIAKQVSQSPPTMAGYSSGRIVIRGYEIVYSIFLRDNGVINIGSYHVVD